MGIRQEWEAAAEERGKERGLVEGERRGELKGQAKTLLTLLKLRFVELPNDVPQRLLEASSDDLDRWTERILEAKTLDEVW